VRLPAGREHFLSIQRDRPCRCCSWPGGRCARAPEAGPCCSYGRWLMLVWWLSRGVGVCEPTSCPAVSTPDRPSCYGTQRRAVAPSLGAVWTPASWKRPPVSCSAPLPVAAAAGRLRAPQRRQLSARWLFLCLFFTIPGSSMPGTSVADPLRRCPNSTGGALVSGFRLPLTFVLPSRLRLGTQRSRNGLLLLGPPPVRTALSAPWQPLTPLNFPEKRPESDPF